VVELGALLPIKEVPSSIWRHLTHFPCLRGTSFRVEIDPTATPFLLLLKALLLLAAPRLTLDSAFVVGLTNF
jgi:hypothetical protein